jgi:hypothetical protein
MVMVPAFDRVGLSHDFVAPVRLRTVDSPDDRVIVAVVGEEPPAPAMADRFIFTLLKDWTYSPQVVGTPLSIRAVPSVKVGTTVVGMVTVTWTDFVPITVDPDKVVTVTVAAPEVAPGMRACQVVGTLKVAEVVNDDTVMVLPAIATVAVWLNDEDARDPVLIVTVSLLSAKTEVLSRVGVVALGIVVKERLPPAEAVPALLPSYDAVQPTVLVPSALCPTTVCPEATSTLPPLAARGRES